MDAFVSELLDLVSDIKEFSKGLTEPEIFEIAAQVQRNKIEYERNAILSSAFVVDKRGSMPSALEAIAMQLGYKKGYSGYDNNIVDAIYNLNSKEE